MHALTHACTHARTCMHTLIHIIRCHGSEVYLVMALIQNDDSYLSNELAHVGKSSEVVAIMKN